MLNHWRGDHLKLSPKLAHVTWVANSRLAEVTLQQFDRLANLSFPLLLNLVNQRKSFCSLKLGSSSSLVKVGHKFICGKSGSLLRGRAVADPGFAETLQHQQLDQYSLLSGTTHHPPLVAPPQPTGTHRKSKLFRNPLLTNTPFSWEAQHDPEVPVASHQVSSEKTKLSHESGKEYCDFVKKSRGSKNWGEKQNLTCTESPKVVVGPQWF